MDDLKLSMMKLSNTDHVNEALINDHSSKVAAMMLDPKSPVGKGYENLLNDYTKKVAEYAGIPAEKIAKAPKDLALFANDDNHKNKDFLTFTFENTPVIAALASVTQAQTEVLEYESKALTELRKKANVGNVSFDNIVPMVRPEASIVAAGAKYRAQLFISASSSSFNPQFVKDGQNLPVIDEAGVKMGVVEFVASGGAYDPKTLLAKKTFKAEIKLPDTTYTRVIEYFVAQPVIKVTTGNAPTLYMNCGNTVNIEVPALGTNYNPSFSGQGAEIIKGDKPGKVTIIPAQRKVTVGVSNGGSSLGTVNFDVKPIPRPRYVIKDNSGKDVDMKTGVRGSALTGLRVIAEAEENFKQEVPKDANYRIRSMSIIHARGTSPINTMNATNENLELAPWRSQFRPGDIIVIEIKNVMRRTFKGAEEKVEVKSEVYRVPII
jgi:gliding motility-associated protein GldM